ncbi:hypothetical protein JTE90_006371 [Oedothorax gibbosus]|uniref:Uncharacterized protein n=1 Tax=Oedothorax gibbosus TaxID=931172 RepID=A0AAV6VVL8_9ARAC|nr:hypothetical protein JTE90_006371 [Oedothorax gibbosus]
MPQTPLGLNLRENFIRSTQILYAANPNSDKHSTLATKTARRISTKGHRARYTFFCPRPLVRPDEAGQPRGVQRGSKDLPGGRKAGREEDCPTRDVIDATRVSRHS